jgi:hypothetical protein
MNFVAIEAPATGIAFAGEAIELLDAAFGVVSAGEGLEIVADELVEALAESFGLLAGASDELFVDREGDVYVSDITQYMWARVMCQAIGKVECEVKIPTLVAKDATKDGAPAGFLQGNSRNLVGGAAATKKLQFSQ